MTAAAATEQGSGSAFDAVAIGTAIQRRIGVKTSRDEPLARFTTMRVGGPADLFATVHNVHELRAIVRFARSREIPLTLLGRGSDVVIADAGVRGLVVQNRAEGSRIDETTATYTAESGVPMARAATETQKAGLLGPRVRPGDPGHRRRRGVGERRGARERRRRGRRLGRRPPRRRHRIAASPRRTCA